MHPSFRLSCPHVGYARMCRGMRGGMGRGDLWASALPLWVGPPALPLPYARGLGVGVFSPREHLVPDM